MLPGPVPGHAILHQLLPGRFIVVHIDGTSHLSIQYGRIKVPEGKPIRSSVFKVGVRGIHDGICQTADFMHDGNSAINQAIHLVQTTGFKLTGHQEDIQAGFDLVGQDFVKADERGNLIGKSSCQFAEGGLVVRVSRSEDDELHVCGQQVFGGIQDIIFVNALVNNPAHPPGPGIWRDGCCFNIDLLIYCI